MAKLEKHTHTKQKQNKLKQYLDRFNFRVLTVFLVCSTFFDCLSTDIAIFGDDSHCAKIEMVFLILEMCGDVSEVLAQFPLVEEK